MDQVKGRKDAARRDAKPWENFGQQDTDPYREDVGKLRGAVRTELSKLQEETGKQAGSQFCHHSSTAEVHDA